MIYNKWEDEPVDITVHLLGDYRTQERCTFVFNVDGEPPQRVEYDIVDEKVTSTWSPPARGEDAPLLYNVWFHIEVAGKDVTGGQQIVVWARSLRVKAVDAQGQPVAGAKLLVNGGA